jgi:hypothetical protein
MANTFNKFTGVRVEKNPSRTRDLNIPKGLYDGNAYYAWMGKRWYCFRNEQILAIGFKDMDHYWLGALCRHLNDNRPHITGYKLDFGFKQPKMGEFDLDGFKSNKLMKHLPVDSKPVWRLIGTSNDQDA